MIAVTSEGAFTLSKATHDPGMVAAQLDHYLTYLESLFALGGG